MGPLSRILGSGSPLKMLRRSTALLTMNTIRQGPLSSNCDGASAIEFAFLAPIGAVALLLLGLASQEFYHQIQMDQIIRAGAVAAAQELDGPEVESRMKAVALQKGYTLAQGPANFVGELVVQAAKNCWCPEDPMGNVDCRDICGGHRPTVVRYVLDTAYFPDYAWIQPMRQALLGLGVLPGWFGGRIVAFSEVNVR